MMLVNFASHGSVRSVLAVALWLPNEVPLPPPHPTPHFDAACSHSRVRARRSHFPRSILPFQQNVRSTLAFQHLLQHQQHLDTASDYAA